MLHIKANAYCPCIACSPQTTSIMAGLTEPWNIPGMIHVINEEEMWWKVMIKFTSRRLLSFLIDTEDKKKEEMKEKSVLRLHVVGWAPQGQIGLANGEGLERALGDHSQGKVSQFIPG